jgi:hypothetical protein
LAVGDVTVSEQSIVTIAAVAVVMVVKGVTTMERGRRADDDGELQTTYVLEKEGGANAKRRRSDR